MVKNWKERYLKLICVWIPQIFRGKSKILIWKYLKVNFKWHLMRWFANKYKNIDTRLFFTVRLILFSDGNQFISLYIYIYIYIYIYHHHIVPLARVSLTLSHHFSPSFIASGRSSGLHLVSSHSWCIYVLAGRPAFAQRYVGVDRSTSLMSSSLLLQQCPACLVGLTWIVFHDGRKVAYSWCFVECCRQYFFNIARNILV